MRVSTNLCFLELIVEERNKMSLIVLALLIKYVTRFTIESIRLHANLDLSIVVLKNKSNNKDSLQFLENISRFLSHCEVRTCLTLLRISRQICQRCNDLRKFPHKSSIESREFEKNLYILRSFRLWSTNHRIYAWLLHLNVLIIYYEI